MINEQTLFCIGLSYRKIIARGDDDFALSSFKLPTWELPHVL